VTTQPYDCAKLLPSDDADAIVRLDRIAGDKLDLFEVRLQLDGETYLPDDLLVKVDRASMVVSLECREPLLDYRLSEFARTLPVNYHLKPNSGKRILRDVLYRYVPRELVNRPKIDFTPPIGRWLRQGLKTWAEGILFGNDERLDGLVELGWIRNLWQEHQSGRHDHKNILWHLLVLHHCLLCRRWK
jgi:asparagine synthase (glutamine-hydrolysing)